MSQPNIFIVKPEHVGSTDVPQFLLNVISKEFDGKYEIKSETTQDRIVPYAKGLRKIKSYLVEGRGEDHSLHFDITEVSAANANAVNWLGNH
jgi:hypothetical protein